MDRTSSEELISAYFDGETTPEENVVVERLLADPANRQALEEYRHLREELQAIPVAEPSAEWSRRLRERLAQERPAWAARIREPEPVAATGSESHHGHPRSLWTAALVGLAAGTLGIFIGWSAQNVGGRSSLEEVAHTGAGDSRDASPAPHAATTADFAPSAPLSGYSDLVTESEVKSAVEGEAVDATMGDGAGILGTEVERMRRLDEARLADLASGASAESAQLAKEKLGEALAAGVDGTESGDTMAGELAESNTFARKNEVPGSAKQIELMREKETLDEKESLLDLADDVDATYVGLWYDANAFGSDRLYVAPTPAEKPAADSLTSSGASSSAPLGAMSLAQQDASEDAQDKSQEIDALARWDKTPPTSGLVIEGSPELVADALEALSRSDSGAGIRLFKRFGDGDERNDESSSTRDRRLSAKSEEGLRQSAVEAQEARLALQPPADSARLEGVFDAPAANDEAVDRADPRGLAMDDQIVASQDAYFERESGLARIDKFMDQRKAYWSIDRSPEDSSNGQAYGFGSGGGSFGGFGGGVPIVPTTPFAESASAAAEAARRPEVEAANVASRDASDEALAGGSAGSRPQAQALAARGGPSFSASGVRGSSQGVPAAAAPAMIAPTPPPPAPAPVVEESAPSPSEEPAPAPSAPAPATNPAADLAPGVVGKAVGDSAPRRNERAMKKIDDGEPRANPEFPADRGAPEVYGLSGADSAESAEDRTAWQESELREGESDRALSREPVASAATRVRVILLSPEALARLADFQPAVGDAEVAAEAAGAAPPVAGPAPAAPTEP